MKTCLQLSLILAATILAATRALAVPPLYGANLNGVLTTEVLTSSTTSKYVNTAVNNATITNALFKTGTSGVLKASDMALVYTNSAFGLAVVNASNGAVLYNLAVSGSNQLKTIAILAPTARINYYTLGISDVEFRIPSVSGTNPPVFTGPVITNWSLRETVDLATGFTPLAATATFNGGSGTGGTGSTIFRGTIALNGRTY